MIKKTIHIFFINLLLLTLLSAELKVGENFPSLALMNPYNETLTISKEDEIVLISFDKDSSASIQKFLEKQEADFLTQHHMMYISDISSLPKFLVNIFVLPKLKTFKFEVALLYEEHDLNQEEGKITVVYLKDNVVEKIVFVPRDKLESFMAKPASF